MTVERAGGYSRHKEIAGDSDFDDYRKFEMIIGCWLARMSKGLFFRVPLTDKSKSSYKVARQTCAASKTFVFSEKRCLNIPVVFGIHTYSGLIKEEAALSKRSPILPSLSSLGLKWLLPIHRSTYPPSTNGTLGRASPALFTSPY
jgi:hypothetical protein